MRGTPKNAARFLGTPDSPLHRKHARFRQESKKRKAFLGMPPQCLAPTLRAFVLALLLRLPRPVLVCLLGDWNRIDAAEPAVEIDVGAAPAAERTKFLCHGLAAHGACSGAKPIAVFGHDLHMGAHSARSN